MDLDPGRPSEEREAAIDALGEFCAPGARTFDRMVPLPTGVSLRLVTFTPAAVRQPFPVVLVPGLVSVMATFRNLLVELTRDSVVHYVETREKASSVVPARALYDVRTIGADLVEAVAHLGLADRSYILFGASLGATAMIDRAGDFRAAPLCLVLLEPNAVFDYPSWSLPIIRFGAPFYRTLKPVAKWYLRNFRVNTAEDYEMYRINCRALDAADPYRLRETVLAISSYEIWGRLGSVKAPALIVSASKDTFHRHGDILRIVAMIEKSTPCDLEKHDRIHSPELVERLRAYVGGL
jgi:hypothetical protein